MKYLIILALLGLAGCDNLPTIYQGDNYSGCTFSVAYLEGFGKVAIARCGCSTTTSQERLVYDPATESTKVERDATTTVTARTPANKSTIDSVSVNAGCPCPAEQEESR